MHVKDYSEQPSAAQLEEHPAELHEADDDAPEDGQAVGLGTEGRSSVGPHHDQAGESRYQEVFRVAEVAESHDA